MEFVVVSCAKISASICVAKYSTGRCLPASLTTKTNGRLRLPDSRLMLPFVNKLGGKK